METDLQLQNGDSGMRMEKTWKTMKDERVRPANRYKTKKGWKNGKPGKYDHKSMNGVSCWVDEEFKLPSGATTQYPGGSGVAGEDINCRCYLSYMVRKVAENDDTGYNEIKLADDEEWAVNSYVSFDSYPLNDALRNDIPLNAKQQKLSDNLDRALEKIPCFEGNLNRSLYFTIEDAIQYFNLMVVGEKIVFKEFLSTTKEGVYNSDGNIQIFIQNSARGHDLGKFNKREKEVLYSRNSFFKVVNKQQRNGIYYILLEEA